MILGWQTERVQVRGRPSSTRRNCVDYAFARRTETAQESLAHFQTRSRPHSRQQLKADWLATRGQLLVAYKPQVPNDFEPPNLIGTKFHSLAESWKSQAARLPRVIDMVMLPSYQQIIGLGEQALPFILLELQQSPDHWFWALRAITGEDPVPPEERGNVAAMRRSWLRWGAERGYVTDG